MNIKYHKWTSHEEAIIRKEYEGGRYKGIIHTLADVLKIAKGKVANHIKEMRKHNRMKQ